MSLWSVSYNTESGDEGYAGLFDEEPTEEHLYAWTLANLPCELVHDDFNGVIETTNLVHFKIERCQVERLPDPVELPPNYCTI